MTSCYHKSTSQSLKIETKLKIRYTSRIVFVRIPFRLNINLHVIKI